MCVTRHVQFLLYFLLSPFYFVALLCRRVFTACQTSTMEFFSENSQRLKVANYFREKALS